MDYQQKQYLSQLRSRLRNFTWLHKGAHFSCPFCGDSSSNKTKRRGYMLTKQEKCYYYCHNDQSCNCSFDNFLKRIDNSLYDQYRLDKFQSSVKPRSKPKASPEDFEWKQFSLKPSLKLPSIKSLKDTHPAKKYITDRKIPMKVHGDLFFARYWMKYVNETKGEEVYSEKALYFDHPRLVIPLRDADGNIFAFQGRAFHKCDQKYVTIKLDENAVKIYGQDKVTIGKPIPVLEGPIDSMFINNSIAMAGSDVSLETCPFEKDRIFVLDNEPRNLAIVKKYKKLIKAGEKVVSWLHTPLKGKDINEMVLNGHSIESINEYILNHTKQGLMAELEFNQWKNV